MALDGLRQLAPLAPRLVAGLILTYHGYEKTLGDGATKFRAAVSSFGLPAPEIMAEIAAWGEFAGGILLIVGLFTRFAALINCGTMVVGIWKVHMPGEFTTAIKDVGEYQLPLAVLALCVSLVLSGAGALSLDRFLFPGRGSRVVT
jgi:putative oxidoreductase